jgi:hypothetical protein
VPQGAVHRINRGGCAGVVLVLLRLTHGFVFSDGSKGSPTNLTLA